MVDALQKQWSKRHGAAVKRGIEKAKAHKKVVKRATLALRKAPKQDIVQRLFTPTRRATGPPPPSPPSTSGDHGDEEEEATTAG